MISCRDIRIPNCVSISINVQILSCFFPPEHVHASHNSLICNQCILVFVIDSFICNKWWHVIDFQRYIHIYTHTHTHTHMRLISNSTYTHTHIHTYTHTHTHTDTHTHMHKYTHTHIHTYTRTCDWFLTVHTHIHTYTHTHIHTYTHTHIHTYTHTHIHTHMKLISNNSTHHMTRSCACAWHDALICRRIDMHDACIKFIAYGKEIAPTTNSPHLQGYIVCWEPQSRASWPSGSMYIGMGIISFTPVTCITGIKNYVSFTPVFSYV